jgi:uncharacterized DUF497 family protein
MRPAPPNFMRFEWDDRKNRANIEKHGLSFASAKAAFQGPMATKGTKP